MSESLRIQVEPVQGAPAPGAGTFVQPSKGPGYTTTGVRMMDDDARMGGFRKAAQDRRDQEEADKKAADKIKKQRARDDAQERDEAWLARQEARQARKQERDENFADRQEAKDARKAAAEQKANEDYIDRQEAKDRKKRERDAARGLQQQEADEDWYARDQKRRQDEINAKDPVWLAKKMAERQALHQATQREFLANQLGVNQGQFNSINMGANIAQNANAVLQRVMGGRGGSFTAGGVNQGLASVASSATMAARALGIAGAVVMGLNEAWNAAKAKLLEEGARVSQFSAELRVQSVRNTLRDLGTDMRIANEYGAQIAGVQDRENRQASAWRIIETRVASAIEPIVRPFSELYTSILEWVAGTGTVSAENKQLLSKLVNLTEQQMEAMGVSASTQNAIADAARNAQKVVEMLGSNGFDKDDPVGNFDHTGQKLFGNNDSKGFPDFMSGAIRSLDRPVLLGLGRR